MPVVFSSPRYVNDRQHLQCHYYLSWMQNDLSCTAHLRKRTIKPESTFKVIHVSKRRFWSRGSRKWVSLVLNDGENDWNGIQACSLLGDRPGQEECNKQECLGGEWEVMRTWSPRVCYIRAGGLLFCFWGFMPARFPHKRPHSCCTS